MHGKNNRLYFCWYDMMRRCFRPDYKQYPQYGGRGITVCEEWKNDREAFYKWAYSNGYSDELTIDRINNNGNYEPNNCRWATTKEQSNNRRSNSLYTYNGKTQTLQQWADELGILSATLSRRLRRHKNIPLDIVFSSQNIDTMKLSERHWKKPKRDKEGRFVGWEATGGVT